MNNTGVGLKKYENLMNRIDELNSEEQIFELEEEIKDAKTRIKNLEDLISLMKEVKTEEQIDTARLQVQRQEDKIARTKEEWEELLKTHHNPDLEEDYNRNMSNLNTDLETYKSELQALEEQFGTNIDTLTAGLENYNNELKALEDKKAKMIKDFAEMKKEAESKVAVTAEDAIQRLNNKKRTLQDDLEKAKKRYNDITSSYYATGQNKTYTAEEIVKRDKRRQKALDSIYKIENQLKEIDKALATIKSETYSNSISDIRIGNMISQIDMAMESCNNFETKLNEVKNATPSDEMQKLGQMQMMNQLTNSKMQQENVAKVEIINATKSIRDYVRKKEEEYEKRIMHVSDNDQEVRRLNNERNQMRIKYKGCLEKLERYAKTLGIGSEFEKHKLVILPVDPTPLLPEHKEVKLLEGKKDDTDDGNKGGSDEGSSEDTTSKEEEEPEKKDNPPIDTNGQEIGKTNEEDDTPNKGPSKDDKEIPPQDKLPVGQKLKIVAKKKWDWMKEHPAKAVLICVGVATLIYVASQVAPVVYLHLQADAVKGMLLNGSKWAGSNALGKSYLHSANVLLSKIIGGGAFNASTGVWTFGGQSIGAVSEAITSAASASSIMATLGEYGVAIASGLGAIGVGAALNGPEYRGFTRQIADFKKSSFNSLKELEETANKIKDDINNNEALKDAEKNKLIDRLNKARGKHDTKIESMLREDTKEETKEQEENVAPEKKDNEPLEDLSKEEVKPLEEEPKEEEKEVFIPLDEEPQEEKSQDSLQEAIDMVDGFLKEFQEKNNIQENVGPKKAM